MLTRNSIQKTLFAFLILIYMVGCSSSNKVEKSHEFDSSNQLLKIEISKVEKPKLIEVSDYESDRVIYYFPVVIQTTNLSDTKLQIDYGLKCTDLYFPSTKQFLTDSCSFYMGRRSDLLNVCFPSSKTLKPHLKLVDTAYYRSCIKYNGNFQVYYNRRILNKKKINLSNASDTLFSNLIQLNYYPEKK